MRFNGFRESKRMNEETYLTKLFLSLVNTSPNLLFGFFTTRTCTSVQRHYFPGYYKIFPKLHWGHDSQITWIAFLSTQIYATLTSLPRLFHCNHTGTYRSISYGTDAANSATEAEEQWLCLSICISTFISHCSPRSTSQSATTTTKSTTHSLYPEYGRSTQHEVSKLGQLQFHIILLPYETIQLDLLLFLCLLYLFSQRY